MKINGVLLSLILLTPYSVFASVRITEVMYDVSGTDSGREWIEVLNDGNTPVDLSTYKLFEGEVNHKILAYKGDALLSAGGVAILTDNPSKFLVDWPNTPGAVLDSAFSLSNTGETISIKDRDLKVDDTATFSANGASGNGLSLARGDDRTFVSSKPTPGKYVGTPIQESIAVPSKSETATSKPQLQKDMPAEDGQDTVSVRIEGEEKSADAANNTPDSVWLWGLGALGLSLLGAGGIYALKMHAPVEDGRTALKREADTYEIIE